MISLNKIFIILLLCLTSSCVSVTKSYVRENDTLTIPNPDSYTVIGAIQVSKTYFDLWDKKDNFETEAHNILHKTVPDALYDLDGDTCWITNFNYNSNTIKCLGLCSQLTFDIVVLKHK